MACPVSTRPPLATPKMRGPGCLFSTRVWGCLQCLLFWALASWFLASLPSEVSVPLRALGLVVQPQELA